MPRAVRELLGERRRRRRRRRRWLLRWWWRWPVPVPPFGRWLRPGLVHPVTRALLLELPRRSCVNGRSEQESFLLYEHKGVVTDSWRRANEAQRSLVRGLNFVNDTERPVNVLVRALDALKDDSAALRRGKCRTAVISERPSCRKSPELPQVELPQAAERGRGCAIAVRRLLAASLRVHPRSTL